MQRQRSILTALVMIGLVPFCRTSVGESGSGSEGSGEGSSENAHIVAIEEDWKLVVKQPNEKTASPQVATQMNPVADSDDAYAIFSLNYQQLPSYVGGGMEIQMWHGGEVVDVDGSDGLKLAVEHETITWTQRLRIHEGKLRFRIKDGKSTTYGDFGNDTFYVQDETSMVNLDQFSGEASIKNSGVTLGANRVKLFQRTQIRYYYSNGTVISDKNVRKVHETLDEEAAAEATVEPAAPAAPAATTSNEGTGSDD